MNLKKALASALQLFASAAFFAGALFFISLPFLPSIRFQIADVLLNSPKVCTPIGVGFLLAAVLLFAGFYGANRGRFLHIRMGSNRASVDREVIHKALEECFQRQFPNLIALSDIDIVRGRDLEIEVCLVPLEEGFREELFVEVQSKLQPLLQEQFGYAKPFLLIVKS